MKTFSVDLKDLYNVSGGKLTAYIAESPFDDIKDDYKRPAVIVVPGGGYYFVSKREAEPVGSYFTYAGFQVFILDYLCNPDGARYPEQLYELACAVDYVKKNASDLLVDANNLFAVGFSAGGHLVADLSVEYEKAQKDLGLADCKPTAVGLSYAVISPEYKHTDSFKNLLEDFNDNEKQKLLESLRLDKKVNAQTPPTFIWTTAEDNCVPPQNSLRYAEALSLNGVPFELHVYPHGWHGLSNCIDEVNPAKPSFLRKNSQWMSDCADFFHDFSK